MKFQNFASYDVKQALQTDFLLSRNLFHFLIHMNLNLQMDEDKSCILKHFRKKKCSTVKVIHTVLKHR